ncbi:hypothetical protein [Shewanella decolorationis]|uniref:Membrane protein n=1 Tax=Shewanella decolorationis S12 TaxID=1353536 RepID=A0ABP2Z479_9GAMM|nr:hypothetical protein [Shewanella decolorationis]ESE41037.1 membrane protein [Shewanella decolorationis S12]GLR30531.1 hypothetical protein GCM10007922_00870 [Shewanella decolorationis]
MAPSVFWLKHKYKLSGLILILPLVFLYQSLSPSFPPAWPSQQLGEFKIAPMPLDLKAPYKHHDDYVKDFMLIFEQGDVAHIRQGYANIGPEALPLEALQKGENGVLHGSKHGQHVHAITGAKLAATDSLWVSIQNWQGEWLVSQWPVPEAVLVQ